VYLLNGARGGGKKKGLPANNVSSQLFMSHLCSNCLIRATNE
jgi:hypothetical protein